LPLRHGSEFASAVLETIRQPTLVLGEDLCVEIANAVFHRAFGTTPQEVEGKPFADLAERLLAMPALPETLTGILNGAEPVSGIELRRKIPGNGGRSFALDARRIEFRQPSQRHLLLILDDVTEPEEHDRRRDAERAQFRARLLEAVGQGVIATAMDGSVTYWNQAAERLYGWTAAEAAGRQVTELTPSLHTRAQASAIMDALRRGESWTGEFEVQRKDGSRFCALVTDTPFLDDAGNLVGIVGVSSDLTERKELEGQLRQAQKMEAIGRLAGGIAHDFNNLLTAINGHARLLLEDLPADSPLANDAHQILSAGDRAAALTRQLLAFSRKQVLEKRAVDLRRVAGDMEQMLRRLIPERIELILETDDQPVVVRVDPGQLGQVLLNLVVNAGDAIEGAGRVTIGVGHTAMTPELAARIPWTVPPGRYAHLTVQDTGSGIPDDVLDQIFDPFFTTKPEGRGTGLGLSTVYGIVKQSDGYVLVDTEQGVGTTFRVLLPVTTDVPEEAVQEPEPARIRKGATVLLVEDDSAVRTLAMRVLDRVGYRVLAATNGRDAIEIAAANPDIDLVLSDIVMPEMSGGELVDQLRETHPDLKVVLTSGYSEADLQGDVRHRGAAFLAKPFTPESLRRCIASVLGA
jgi:two-component system cell cycle sensor histidine kinase/response regulator CckA